jgi:hypothetical protein
LPDGKHRLRRSALTWKLAAAFVAGALVAGIAVALILGSNNSTKPPLAAPDINMAAATGLVCSSPVPPGPAHPDVVLSQLFDVHAGKVAYTLGWTIVPFRGADRTYRFGTPSALLALEPATGGRPVGYGKGTVTFRQKPDAGTINAVITLKAGAPLTVRGSWNCVVSGITGITGTTGTTGTISNPT